MANLESDTVYSPSLDGDDDYVMEGSDEVEDIEMEQPEGTLSKPQPKRSKSKSNNTASNSTKSLPPPTNFKNQTNTQPTINLSHAFTSPNKSARDLTYVQRFTLLFGLDQSMFDEFTDYAINWYNVLFYIEEEKLKSIVNKGTHKVNGLRPMSEADLKIDSSFELDHNQTPLDDENLQICISKGNSTIDYTLKTGEPEYLKTFTGRNAIAINLGGCVTSSKWLPVSGVDSKELFLAVSVLNGNTGDIKDLVNSPDISLFNNSQDPKDIKTSIQIWKFDLSSNNLQLYHHITTTKFGATTNLSWLPMNVQSTKTLGILIGSFTDGRIHVLKIPKHEDDKPRYSLCESSLTYEIKDETTEKKHEVTAITSYAVISDNKILAGLSDGTIAEFILPTYKTNSDFEVNAEEEDISIPSFLQRVSTSAIVSITVANPKEDIYYAYVTTSDLNNLIFQYDNQQIRTLRSYVQTVLESSYFPALRLFITLESSDVLGYFSARTPQERPTLMLKSECISSFLISEFIGHPLAIIGDSLGSLYIVNFTRKLLAKSRASNKLLVPLKLWSFFKDENDKFVLRSDFVEVPPEKTLVKTSILPPEIAFSTTSWSEDLSGSSIYAAGSMSGLLIVERLDPKFS